MLINDLLKEFIFDLKIKNHSNRTIETYNYNVTPLIAFLNEHHDLSELEDGQQCILSGLFNFN